MRPLRRVVALSFLWCTQALAAPDPWAGGGSAAKPVFDELKGPEPERGPTTKVPLPSVPAFELPIMPAGTHSVRELLVAGKPLLNTELQVSGYVTWIYDCEVENRKPRESQARVRRRIDEDPTICQRAKFYLGDTRDTVPERSMWIVDVPRPFNKLEVERIRKEDRTLANYPDRCEPDPKRPRAKSCMPLEVGDYVTITGTFAVASPHRERNSDGLIVFRSLTRVPPPTTPPTMRPFVAASPKRLPALAATPVNRPPANALARDKSIRSSNEGMKAYGQKRFADAIPKFREAVTAWEGNHQAWYGLAGVHIGTQNWAEAATASAKAFELLPTNPMYAMVQGYSLYNAAIWKARQDTARRENVPPESVTPDVSSVDFSRAEQLLRHAVTLDDALWRAHYYLGRIARDSGRPSDAAQSFTKAVSAGPKIPEPWIALGELYRRWKYSDQSRQVVEQALQFVPATDTSDLWYIVGMAHDEQRQDAKAIAAFTKALEVLPTNLKARFQRGQALFRSGKRAEAKRDLTAVLAAPASSLEFAKQQAQKMLFDLAATK